jgi:hypothetical protein
MVINTNLPGTGGTQPAKSNGRTSAQSKSASSPSNQLDDLAQNSAVNSLPGDDLDISDPGAASQLVQFSKSSFFNHPAQAMLAHSNLSPETALRLLQD